MKTETEPRKGLRVCVYRAADRMDCTLGGITSRVERATLIGDGIEGVFEPTDDAPALYLVKRNIRGEYFHCQPDDPDKPKERHLMFGGNFVASSDSRMPIPYPIPVHDRWER